MNQDPRPAPIKAIVLDCFGTVVRIGAPARPFRRMFAALPDAERARAGARLMSNPWDLRECAQQLGVRLGEQSMQGLEGDLARELASIECYAESIAVLDALRRRGVKVALCSNLALPYATPVERLLGERVDAYIWSFAVGAIKPDPAIYASAAEALQLPRAAILMAGDARREDYEGARLAGFQARHLVRGPTASCAPEEIVSLHALLELIG